MLAGYDRDIIGEVGIVAYTAGVDYAALLPKSLLVARAEIGVPSLLSAHPEGLPTAGRLLRQLEERVTLV